MTPEAYRKRIEALGLTQEEAGRILGGSSRSGQRWASEGPPVTVAMLLLAIGKDRKRLDLLARRCNNS